MDKDHRPQARLSRSWRRISVRVLLVAMASMVPFLPGLGGPFLFDDIHTVFHNPAIRSLETLRFFTDSTAFSVKPGNWPYRPVVLLVNSLQYRLSILDPLPWHALQLIIHFINSLLVMVMAEKVFRLGRGAVFAGLLFAAAPIQTQAVVYVSARSIVIACAPALVALMAIVEAASGPERHKGWMATALIASALAFFSSEAALALVIWIPIAFYAAGIRPGSRRAWLVVAGVLVLAVLFFLARAGLSPGPALGGHPLIKPAYSAFENAILQLRAPFIMARLFALPVHLSILHHPHPPSLSDPRTLLAGLGLAATFAVTVRFRGLRAPCAGLLWYLASLLPAVFIPLNVPWAEHRAYLAFAGLAVASGWCIEWLVSILLNEARYLWLGLAYALFIAIIAGFGLLSFHRAHKWRSSQSIFADAARKAPAYEVPWNFLAVEAYKNNEFEKALHYLDLALARNPGFADAHNTRANCMIKLERPVKALESARRAVELDPVNSTYYNSLAVALMMEQRWEEAERALRSARERLFPDDPNRPMIERNWRSLRQERRAQERKNHKE